ncbi:MAG TPA: hypothetical protein VFG30_25450 [Polyangiales bacterium]|nr:hypothetical protein [Polyangiales bacterium]
MNDQIFSAPFSLPRHRRVASIDDRRRAFRTFRIVDHSDSTHSNTPSL